jgi:hypothetical protein
MRFLTLLSVAATAGAFKLAPRALHGAFISGLSKLDGLKTRLSVVTDRPSAITQVTGFASTKSNR